MLFLWQYVIFSSILPVNTPFGVPVSFVFIYSLKPLFVILVSSMRTSLSRSVLKLPHTASVWELKQNFVKRAVNRALRLRERPLREIFDRTARRYVAEWCDEFLVSQWATRFHLPHFVFAIKFYHATVFLYISRRRPLFKLEPVQYESLLASQSKDFE